MSNERPMEAAPLPFDIPHAIVKHFPDTPPGVYTGFRNDEEAVNWASSTFEGGTWDYTGIYFVARDSLPDGPGRPTLREFWSELVHLRKMHRDVWTVGRDVFLAGWMAGVLMTVIVLFALGWLG